MESSAQHDAVAIHRRIGDAAQAYLDGTAGATETARIVATLAHKLDASFSQLLTGFVGVDSETDTFPLGSAREHWSVEALAREDADREEYEARISSEFAAMCRQVVAVFNHAPPNRSLERGRER